MIQDVEMNQKEKAFWLPQNKRRSNHASRYEHKKQTRTNRAFSQKEPATQWEARARKVSHLAETYQGKKPTVITELIKPQIIAKLKQRWSPEQIAGRAKLKNEYNISHQSISNLIATDTKNGGMLYKYLRRKRKYRKHKTKESHIKAHVMIDRRPEVVEKRQRLGDW